LFQGWRNEAKNRGVSMLSNTYIIARPKTSLITVSRKPKNARKRSRFTKKDVSPKEDGGEGLLLLGDDASQGWSHRGTSPVPALFHAS